MTSQHLYTGALKTVRTRPKSPAQQRTGAASTRLFKVPEQYLSALQTWRQSASDCQPPCQLKTAASVVFVRDGKDGLETIMTYRPGTSPLGTLAFPGGVCQQSDRAAICWHGPSASKWAQVFKQEDQTLAQAVVVAAIRESFEEVGMLLAGRDELSTLEVSADGCDLMAARQALAQGDKEFADYISKRGLKLRADLLKPLSRWQTPDYRHKRYDTYYFASAVPVGQEPKLLKDKGVWASWLNARDLLAQQDSTALGDAVGQPNTVGKKLQELLTPAVLCTLENLAAASTSVAFLAQKRDLQVNKASIIEQQGSYYLQYTLPG
ncbi:MAG: NUDIX hydrolase [Rothia sp. (in: high G+C Gram-positive bacteria)]|nr:NUDIX hydrolase [Rothia sp. (in: high G+C Gram-positive bacteria)]